MKKIILLIAISLPGWIFAQPADTLIALQNVQTTDSLFWEGYNTCNVALLPKLIDQNIEFYHDKGGITYGEKALTASIAKNICNNANGKIRREAVSTACTWYLLKNGSVIYGAIVSGDHLFYNTPKGAKEQLTGIAKFMNLWLYKEGRWQMSRVLSYDHRPWNTTGQ